MSLCDPRRALYRLHIHTSCGCERRGLGITIRKVLDLIIGTYCIEHGHSLLHDDRDFEPMREHLGLRVI